MKPRKKIPAAIRFANKFIKRHSNECWLWRNYTTDKYPNFWTGNKNQGAHRFALSLKLDRELKPNELACHSCDNKRCVNPNHLFVGSDDINSKDMVAKGRKEKGEAVYGAKLTETKVLWMREQYALGSLLKEIALAVGVTTENAWHVISGRTWKHVGGPLGTRTREQANKRRIK